MLDSEIWSLTLGGSMRDSLLLTELRIIIEEIENTLSNSQKILFDIKGKESAIREAYKNEFDLDPKQGILTRYIFVNELFSLKLCANKKEYFFNGISSKKLLGKYHPGYIEKNYWEEIEEARRYIKELEKKEQEKY